MGVNESLQPLRNSCGHFPYNSTEGMGAEQPQFDVAVEVFEIPDFGQNSEGESYAINALCGIKLGVAPGETTQPR